MEFNRPDGVKRILYNGKLCDFLPLYSFFLNEYKFRQRRVSRLLAVSVFEAIVLLSSTALFCLTDRLSASQSAYNEITSLEVLIYFIIEPRL